jgi:amphi-Trp domain-containing protein
MSSKSGISVKGTMDFQSVTNFLDDLVKSFKDKKVVVQRGDEFVSLVPTDSIDLELEAVMKKGKQKLTVELAWREEVQIEEEVSFRVSSTEPEPKPVVAAEVSCATVCADTPEDAKKAMEHAAEATTKAAASKAEEKKPATGAAKK